MAMISIDGVDLPSPSKYKIPGMDLDSEDSNRNELGYLLRDRIRADVGKVLLEWNGIPSPDVALIKSAIAPAEFNVTFITEIGMVTKRMYAGNREQEMAKYEKETDGIRWDFSFNLTEV